MDQKRNIREMLAELFSSSQFLDRYHIGDYIRNWREQFADTLFFAFTVFGFFSVIPSLYLSFTEKEYIIAAVSIFLYLFCIFMTLNKRISSRVRALTGIILFYCVGILLIAKLGVKGAGEIWLFSTTILAAYLLGNRGALLAFFFNSLSLLTFWFLLKMEIINWEQIYPSAWLIKSVNYIMLNFVFLLAHLFFIRGFRKLLLRAFETRDATIIGLARLAEHRDLETGEHIRRLQTYISILGEELKRNSTYRDYISDEYLRDLKLSVILHDIGKVGIQDSILQKPAKLTPEEFEIIKTHPRIGFDVIKEIEKNISDQSLFTMGKEISLFHHEHWDGTGYPDRLKGDAIPLSARITALVDVYDALTSKRVYKNAFSHEDAVNIILEERGTHFDPQIVDCFIIVAPEFKRVCSISEDKGSEIKS